MDNLGNALVLAQYQFSALQTVQDIVSRMDDLAYRATDFMTTSSERSQLDREFQSLSQTLSGFLYDSRYGHQMFDPMASKYVKDLTIDGTPSGNATRVEEQHDIEAYRGTVKLWWSPYGARDRIQMYQGSSLFFDSGEYRSKVGGNRTEDVNGQTRLGDYFEVDFGKEEVAIRPAGDNKGNADTVDKGKWGGGSAKEDEPHPVGYPKIQAPKGEGSILNFVVNDTLYPAEDLEIVRGSTSWKYWIDVERKAIRGPETLSSSGGDQYELQTKGFSSLSGLSLGDMASAAQAMKMTAQEQDNLSYQMSKLAADFSYINLQRDYLADKISLGSVAIGRISDTDIAAESISLTKNTLLKSATDHALIHSRLATRKIFDLLF